MLNVLWIHRKRRETGNFSIENYFNSIRSYFKHGVNVLEWISPWYSNGVITRLKAVRELRKQRWADIYHITGDVHFLAWSCPPDKTVLTIHDCGFLHHPGPVRRMIYRYFWLKGPVKRCAVVTCVSNATKQEILAVTGAEPTKIRVIPTVIDPRWKRVDHVFNEETPTILQIGTKYNKNLERLIPALKGLSVKLIIVGEISEKQQAMITENRLLVENHVAISFESLQELYSTTDIVTFCSTFEGFGMPVIEANTVGRVVVTSNYSSMPEVAGNAAHLVDPFNVGSIREGILKVISDKEYRGKLIEAGYKNALRFSPEIVAEQYTQIYRELSGLGHNQ